MLRFYTDCFARLANLDEQWCGGYDKIIVGFDEGEAFSDHYDPAKFWNGDYRVLVDFHAKGVDVHTNLQTVASAFRLGWLGKRSSMRKSGLVPNPIAEEKEIALDEMHAAFAGLMAFEAQQGNDAALSRFMELLDSDGETSRTAMVKVMKERKEQQEQAMLAQQQEQQSAMAGAGGGGGMMPPGAPPGIPPELAAMLGGGG
jgi:hypothetical protein